MKIGFVAMCLALTGHAVRINNDTIKLPQGLSQGDADAGGESEFLGCLFGGRPPYGWSGPCGRVGCNDTGSGGYACPNCNGEPMSKFQDEYQRGMAAITKLEGLITKDSQQPADAAKGAAKK